MQGVAQNSKYQMSLDIIEISIIPSRNMAYNKTHTIAGTDGDGDAICRDLPCPFLQPSKAGSAGTTGYDPWICFFSMLFKKSSSLNVFEKSMHFE